MNRNKFKKYGAFKTRKYGKSEPITKLVTVFATTKSAAADNLKVSTNQVIFLYKEISIQEYEQMIKDNSKTA